MALIDAALRGALVALLALSMAVQAVSAQPWVERPLSCAAQSPGIGLSLGAAPISFMLLGLAAVVGPWRMDLVEKRRRRR
jgi:hypothetical protein